MACIDTHCHIDIIEKKGIGADAVLENAARAGIEAIIQVATDVASSLYGRTLSRRAKEAGPVIYWSAGLHPEGADIAQLDEMERMIRENREDPLFVGIGETGLDYFHHTKSTGAQKICFARHLGLAQELNLPVILHLRDDRSYTPGKTQAVTDALKMIRERSSVRGVLHCYTYGPEEALPFLDLGWFVSFSGILTYRNAQIIQDAAVSFPLERILVETDAPFLTPNPDRSKINEPAYVKNTLDFLCDLRSEKLGEDSAFIRKTVRENSINFINLKHQTAR
jgi:TatD DNase family protein